MGAWTRLGKELRCPMHGILYGQLWNMDRARLTSGSVVRIVIKVDKLPWNKYFAVLT